MADRAGDARRPRRRRRRVRHTGRVLRVGDRDVPLLSGAVHYWRLSVDAWEPALREVRGLGFPMVETYVPWSVHEVRAGDYDFGEHAPHKDLGHFLDLATKHDLFVFLRPGPQINAEMTHFGLPERVVYDKACQARSPRQNPVILGFPPRMFPVPSYASTNYHREIGRWYDAVAKVVQPRLWPEGPVVLLQVDNEVAYFFRDGPYEQDYHPDALRMWRTFLEERHGGLPEIGNAHGVEYVSWDDVQPPQRFSARHVRELPLHLDWARFREHLLAHALTRMRRRMARAGMSGVPVVHNLPLGEAGLPLSVPEVGHSVDLVGLDYYHAAREHRTIKRRTLYLAGTLDTPWAPEMGAGAPPWFTPLSHEDSLFCAMAAHAWGLRGMNLYMTVDRDRWYGAPIDSHGTPRVEAGTWKQLAQALSRVRFHELEREAEVVLEVPREYARLSRVTHVLGPLSPALCEAVGGSPVDGCREDTLGLEGPVQVLWWRMLAKLADALTEAGVPYVYVDSEASDARFEHARVVVSPTYEMADPGRWSRLARLARNGTTVVYGPALPETDPRARPVLPESIPGGRKVLLDTPSDATRLVNELVAQCGLQRPFPVTPAPVESAVHGREGEPRVLFLVHPGNKRTDATVQLPRPLVLEDLLHGHVMEGEHRVRVPMEPRSCRMLEIRDPSEESPPDRGGKPRARARRGAP